MNLKFPFSRLKTYSANRFAYISYRPKKSDNNKPIIVFNIKKPHIYHRYLYTFIKFLHIEGYQIYFPKNFDQFRYLTNSDIYLKLILKERLVHFKSPGSEQVYLEFNDKNLSADYFSFLTDPDFQDSLIIPMTLHPLFYHKEFWNKPIKIGRRKRSIFMAGNFNEKTYSAIENIPFKVKSRIEIYNFLLKNQLLSFFSSKSEFLNFIKGNSDNKCILIKRDNFSIAIEDLLNTLGSFNFYFACPGVIIPFSHNIIEAMSAGSIPLIQHAYAEMLQPPLVNNENAIVYNDFDDLQKKIEYCYNLPEDLLNKMNSNVLKYYNENLTPQAVIQKIQKGNYKKFYLQAEFESAKLFRYELLRKNLK